MPNFRHLVRTFSDFKQRKILHCGLDMGAGQLVDAFCVSMYTLQSCLLLICSGVGVRFKVGDKYWEEWRVGSGEGLCPPQLGVWGLAPEKKINFNFVLKIVQFWASFGTFFLYYSIKWGGDYPPVLKVGDLSLYPAPLLRRLYLYVHRNVVLLFWNVTVGTSCRYIQGRSHAVAKAIPQSPLRKKI